MKPHLALLSLLTFASLTTPSVLADDETTIPRNFATVNLFFVNPWLPNPTAEASDGKAGGLGIGAAASMQMQFEAARLYLNGNFVSDLLFRHVDATPTLNLPPGDHKFRIECDGYNDYERTLTVLGNGSQQWLVVKLERRPSPETASPRSSSKD